MRCHKLGLGCALRANYHEPFGPPTLLPSYSYPPPPSVIPKEPFCFRTFLVLQVCRVFGGISTISIASSGEVSIRRTLDRHLFGGHPTDPSTDGTASVW